MFVANTVNKNKKIIYVLMHKIWVSFATALLLTFVCSLVLDSFIISQSRVSFLEVTKGKNKNLDEFLDTFKFAEFAKNFGKENKKVEKPEIRNQKILGDTKSLPVISANFNNEEIAKSFLSILKDRKGTYSVVITDLSTGYSFNYQSDILLPPASTSKIPLGILVLKDIQDGKFDLQTTFPIKEKNKPYDTDALFYRDEGEKLTVEQYLQALFYASDNTALLSLEDMLGGLDVVNKRYKEELGITDFFRAPVHRGTASELARILQKTYKNEYLNEAYTKKLWDLMTNMPNKFQDRIVAGVAKEKEVRVAHKIGELDSDMGYVYNDAGIIFGKNTDILIVVLNANVTYGESRRVISGLSGKSFEIFDKKWSVN